MYLKSIRAQGFKSFADKLDLEINPGITGIVGPNGSGKSNIVDAVRWVLGEQSVRSLRGQNNMTDCIFSGSESREAQKRAMVALVFDNSDHYLHSDFKEVEIKRIVYSTGENEYYINNSRVRLKDITDMFIDSGAGANAFNIISQGNVTDIVNSKSSDRRVIFESAAGVLKYKKRKEESLKKLERTEENLMRIKLVIDELSKTVLPLKEQSVVAKKYLDIKGELESIDVALIAKDITDLNLEYSKVSEEVKALKEKLITLKDNVGDTRLEKLRLRNIELEEVVNKKKEELLKITEDISNLNGEKKLTLERKKYEASKEVIDDNLIKLKESELNVNKNITVLEREILDIEASVNDQREKSEEVKNKLLVIKVKKSTSSNALMEANKAKFLLENKIEILENNILSAEAAPVSVRNILNNPRIHGVHNTIGKLEVKLDNLLEELNNSYNLTYESACGNYNLEMDADIAREHVKNLKKELASLGNVNVGAIDEYERISKRYEFLNSQKYDLESASGELKDIIREMDDIMIDKFKNSFDSISKEFSKIFKMMFKGGKGELSLSNPDDLLNTGIDILAIPPGKKINSPLSLSGGEKALTAICLLFAMLEVKPSPFVILDEAEAALDEVNVDMFGKYLSEEKSRSQFIVITHKKRMMEYADSLYGITMQESGVSKIVSAKLES